MIHLDKIPPERDLFLLFSFRLFPLVADIFDADIFHFALEAVCFVHRADRLMREVLISFTSLAVVLLRRFDGCHTSMGY